MSQTNSIITPGQKTPQIHNSRHQREEYTLEDYEDSLPPLTQQHYRDTPAYSTHFDQNNNTQTKTSSPPASSDLYQLIIKALPILIKLFLSNETTTRIECFLALGSLLQVEKTVSDTLISLGISSLNQ